MKQRFTIWWLIVLSCSISGCATFSKDVFGNKQLVTFKSEPEGARVSVNGIMLGKTPLSIEVDAHKEAVFMMELDDYRTHEGRMFTKLDSLFWGNIICGGFYGSTTDYVTDDMWKYHPNTYFVQLEPKGEKTAEWWKRNRIYSFVFSMKDRLARDVATELDGEVVASLSGVTGIKKTTLVRLGKEYLQQGDALVLARALLVESPREPMSPLHQSK